MADEPIDKTVVVNPDKTAQINASQDDDVTIRIPEIKTAPPKASPETHSKDIGHQSISFTSTRLLNYLTGKKLRNVDDELDSLSARSKAPAQIAWDSGKVILKKLDGSYEIRETLGEGGQGIVSRAFDPSLQRDVALKSLRKELIGNDAARSSFIGEALLTASLDHPAIVPIYSFNTDDDGGLHLAMKVLRGKSLKEHLSGIRSRYERIGIRNFDESESLNYRIDVFLRVCETMAYAHQKRVIHCDLKPENIMIGEYRETYIMDWGIAENMDAPRASGGRIMGTPRYTSPENLAGLKCDQRSDIYSLGVILFELVTLSSAFSGQQITEVIEHVRTGQCNPLRHKFGASIPADLAAIIRKAMAVDPAMRYQKTEDLIDDLRRWSRGAEVSANPDGFFGKIRRWGNHHRRLVLGGAALMAVSSISLSIVGFYAKLAQNTERERRQDNAVNYAYSQTRKMAEQGAMQLASISDMLKLLTSNAALLMDLTEPSKQLEWPRFIDGCTIGKLSGGDQQLLASKLLGGELVDVKNVSASMPDRNDQEKVRNFEREKELMRPMIPTMRQVVLQSIPGIVESREAQLARYRQGGTPVVKSYFCLKSGTIFCYPGLSHMETPYNGCKRPWYTLAEKRRDVPVWGKPYLDSGDASVVMMTCSMALIGADGDFYGVAALDVPMSVFEMQMCRNPECTAYVLQRQVVDGDGRVLIDIRVKDGRFIPIECCDRQNGQLRFSAFADPALLKQMRAGGYGSRITEENGKRILWIYSSIRALDWLYVEKIDLNALMQYPLAIR